MDQLKAGDTIEPPEVSDETIHRHLKEYQQAGMIEYVLPTKPLGEQWIIGYNGQILKFGGDGIVAFLMGIQAGALYASKLKASATAPIWDHPAWGAEARQSEVETPGLFKGRAIWIIPERGPERVMLVSHVERHVITLVDPDEAAEGRAPVDADLPAWPEIKGGALGHLDAAGREISEVADWLRAIDSPLTPAEARAAREALKLARKARDLIDEAKGVLHSCPT